MSCRPSKLYLPCVSLMENLTKFAPNIRIGSNQTCSLLILKECLSASASASRVSPNDGLDMSRYQNEEPTLLRKSIPKVLPGQWFDKVPEHRQNWLSHRCWSSPRPSTIKVWDKPLKKRTISKNLIFYPRPRCTEKASASFFYWKSYSPTSLVMGETPYSHMGYPFDSGWFMDDPNQQKSRWLGTGPVWRNGHRMTSSKGWSPSGLEIYLWGFHNHNCYVFSRGTSEMIP